MITVKDFPNRTFATKEEMFEAFRKSKDILIAKKKSQIKKADSVVYLDNAPNGDGEVIKQQIIANGDVNTLKAQLVINTTNIMDSHYDVHMKGIWKKSISEGSNRLLLKEHKMNFEDIISDTAIASVKNMSWSKVGQPFSGTTQALVFDADIEKNRNEFMFNQYSKGYVKEHSVGMRYIKMALCLNSENKYDVDEKENWDKYIDKVANREVAEDAGFFWAILEAKIIEGSAVVRGSNPATPTLSVKPKEAAPSTSKENNNGGEAAPSTSKAKSNFYLKQLNK